MSTVKKSTIPEICFILAYSLLISCHFTGKNLKETVCLKYSSSILLYMMEVDIILLSVSQSYYKDVYRCIYFKITTQTYVAGNFHEHKYVNVRPPIRNSSYISGRRCRFSNNYFFTDRCDEPF